MNKMLAALTTTAAVLVVSPPIAAHHSLAQFDLTTPIRMRGTVVRFDRINPHSLIFLDQTKEDGQTQRWAIDGPTPVALARRNVGGAFLKAGDVIEVCGFPMKEGDASTRAFEKMQARVMSGHVLEMADGKRWSWNDYGQLDRCLNRGETRTDLAGNR
jgi:uncharacterized protein DUF6152